MIWEQNNVNINQGLKNYSQWLDMEKLHFTPRDISMQMGSNFNNQEVDRTNINRRKGKI